VERNEGGDALQLVREPDNAYDAKAVRLNGKATSSATCARRQRGAGAFHGSRLGRRKRASPPEENRNPWQRMEFEVYLDIANPIQKKTP